MNSLATPSTTVSRAPVATRRIVHRTRGRGHGPITRLMSPDDLGQIVKPFVFLDIFEADMHKMRDSMPMHPHSGIATITVFVRGDVRFEDPQAGAGTLTYGGVEWLRAGGGVWHGKEISPGISETVQGFQLWIALPPELENSSSESQYVEAGAMKSVGPATVILGTYEGVQSPVRAPAGINYLTITLKPGESWTYQPPAGHSAAWLAVAQGALQASDMVSKGEMAIFEDGEGSITMSNSAATDAIFVLGSAVPHPYELQLGYYSVHTSSIALARGETRIEELGRRLQEAGDRRTQSGSTPVFR